MLRQQYQDEESLDRDPYELRINVCETYLIYFWNVCIGTSLTFHYFQILDTYEAMNLFKLHPP